MITLVTGTPGAGKTLWNVNNILKNLLKQNRPIYSNIDGLKIDGVIAVDQDAMTKWMEYPHGSIFIFDECQTVYRPRASGAKVPDYIAAFETHRHHGFDFFLITQYPGFLDKNIRELVGLHVHLYRPFNLKRSQVFEWPAVNPDPNPAQSSSTAARKQFVFPKAAYQHYQSASSHTMKVRLPLGAIILFALGVIAAGGAGFYAFNSMFGGSGKLAAPATQSQAGFPTEDVKDRREGSQIETAEAGICRFMGRHGDTFLLAHSVRGNLAVPRISVLDTCTHLY